MQNDPKNSSNSRPLCKLSNLSSADYLLHVGFLLGLFFDAEDGGDTFFQNVP
jgi:hypothetical protein